MIQLQESTKVTFTNVLYIFFLLTIFFSDLAFLNKGCKVYFEKARCSIYWPNESYLAIGIQKETFFCLFTTSHALVSTGLPRLLLIKFGYQPFCYLGLEKVKKLQDHFSEICLDQTNCRIFTMV